MGVTDWGEINQPLGAPALGGAGGWADSVAQALNNSDETVDARLATLEAAMEALIDTAQGAADAADANADGRVAKSGDTMTGPLTLPDSSPAASEDYVDQRVVGGSKNVSFSAGEHTFNPGLTAAPTAFVITQIVSTGGAANATANFAVAPGVTATSATIYCNVGGSAYTGPAEFSWIAVLP